MARLEELTRGSSIRGILPNTAIAVVDVKWHGTSVIELTYKDPEGKLGHELIFRDREPALEVISAGSPWSFDADGALLRLVSEAYRIRLAHLFDPYLAVHTSLLEPLPHQITAVYGEMLPRQPLRFLLADDPGAGKTIMTGLLIKELLIRGDLRKCLIVCPGMLVEQWQDELYRRFDLPFEILTHDKLESARSGNWFLENPLAICRLDKLSRNEEVQLKLGESDWDLTVCDEAHKMSASFSGGEIKETKRYKLGKLLAQISRHFLLLTATPHNGKEEDFQLFMALLDGDRFEGKFRDGVHVYDTSDLMRRLVKEQLLKFDGSPLFPERLAYTVNYPLSDLEAALYRRVTEYVREEFNRADALENENRKGTVGFALTILQRRLASSPEAIYQSLVRRRARLEKRLREEKLLKRGGDVGLDFPAALPVITQEDVDDLEDAPDGEVETQEEEIVDQATAARTIRELEAEIELLRDLEQLAHQVRKSGTDRKWEELSRLLQEQSEMFDTSGRRRKLVVFTEHRDTLHYLADRVQTLLGRAEALVIIHGGMGREERRKAQEAFTQDKEVDLLIATDAAGEGINLQRAHLMVNYDLPWNPNRLEQRFGRIHRIGQTEVCHLWNLVSDETREGDVYNRLLKKIEEQRKALGDGIFDILGKLFREVPLRELLIEAIRYGDLPEVWERLSLMVDNLADQEHCRELLEERALARESLDASSVRRIREEMERAEARRLQPHYIASFFLEAFKHLGGTVRERETGRYEITHVPSLIRSRDRAIGVGEPVLSRYERITFEKEWIHVLGKPQASFVCPGHPLLDAVLDLIRERYRDLLKRGAILVDPRDPEETPRFLSYLEHSIQDARTTPSGDRQVVSQRMQFVEGRISPTRESGARPHIEKFGNAGYAPYLDYRPITDEEAGLLRPFLDSGAWKPASLEDEVISYAVRELVPCHLEEIRRYKEERIAKTLAAVKDRLTKEINYWDHRAEELRLQELAGKTPKLNSEKARRRADDLQVRLEKRLSELEQERLLSPLPPVVIGGGLVVPSGLLARLRDGRSTESETPSTERIERLAMDAVMERERRLGFEPRDVSKENRGYDIESRNPEQGALRFIEVKGRALGAHTVTVTRNEILTALNKPDQFVLALVVIEEDTVSQLRYLRKPFQMEPEFGVTSITYKLNELLNRGEAPV